jgi:hypothetical protein
MIGLQCVQHFNQDIQVSIESYHGALKCWFSLEMKGLQGHQIDWLTWKLIAIAAQHYMHMSKMKKSGFIKNKVVEQLVKASVDKTTLIPFTHVIKPSMEPYSTWIVQSQRYARVSYKVMHPFIEYASYTCEWAMQGNLCKH